MDAFLLHSGFISLPLKVLEKKEPLAGSLITKAMTANITSVDHTNYYDPEIEKMCRTVGGMIANFEFREALLKKALQLLSYKGSFKDWVSMQMQSPVLTEAHVRYLKDTIAYVCSGKHRDISHGSYRRILNISTNTTAFPEDPFLPMKEMLQQTEVNKVEDFVVRWTQEVEGIVDLLQTLDVIYGPRYLAEGQHVSPT